MSVKRNSDRFSHLLSPRSYRKQSRSTRVSTAQATKDQVDAAFSKFMGAMSQDAALTADEADELLWSFRYLDTDNDGYICTLDMERLIISMGFPICRENFTLLMRELLPNIEIDDMPRVDCAVYLTFLGRMMNSSESIPDDLVEAFKIFDVDEDGFISVEDLMASLGNEGETVTKQEIQDMIRMENSNMALNLDDFIRMITLGKGVRGKGEPHKE